MKLNVWQVTYTSTYSSSSGMTPYTNEHSERTDLVVTAGKSLDDILEAMSKDKIGWAFVIVRCSWLGETVNEVSLRA